MTIKKKTYRPRPQAKRSNSEQRGEGAIKKRFQHAAKGSKKKPSAQLSSGSIDEDMMSRSERIAKVIARAGVCSRRDAEAWIENGRVQLNGELLTSPAVTVTAKDIVLVDGQRLPARERTRLWLYHKPRGLVTTNKDPQGRPTVFSRLPEDLPRVLTVGRLDINTEGLLLLTNDGGLARVLELPSTGWLRRYRVRAFGKVTQADLEGLKDGIAIDGILYGAIEATLDKEQGDNVWMTVGLREGKNREVKRVFDYLGLTVNRLIRLSFGPFQLMDLPENDVREIRGRVLRDQLGDTLTQEAGADFEAPILTTPKQEAQKKPGPAKRRAQSRGQGQATKGKWLITREGRVEKERRETKKPARNEQGDNPKKVQRKNNGPRQEKISPRSRFRMTSELRFRNEDGRQESSPQRRIWSEDGLIEDKQQEKRTGQGRRDRNGGPRDDRRSNRGNRS